MEGGAARRRLRRLELLRADGARGRRRDRRRLARAGARRARVLPGDRPRARERDLQRHRHRAVPARPGHGRPAAPRHRPGAPVGRVRRAASRARRASRTRSTPRCSSPRARSSCSAPARRTRRRSRPRSSPRWRACASERGDIVWIDSMLPRAEVVQILSHATRLPVPVDLRAARHRQPRGDGLRDGRRRDRDRRHPRGRRGRRDGPARPVRAARRRLARPGRPGALRERHRRARERAAGRSGARAAHGGGGPAARDRALRLARDRGRDGRALRKPAGTLPRRARAPSSVQLGPGPNCTSARACPPVIPVVGVAGGRSSPARRRS